MTSLAFKSLSATEPRRRTQHPVEKRSVGHDSASRCVETDPEDTGLVDAARRMPSRSAGMFDPAPSPWHEPPCRTLPE